MKYLTRTIWILSLVSLFTDAASEMLYPVMPMYLQSIGFSVLLIGILEGCAEAIAGLSKGYFGRMSDFSRSRLPFVRVGYALSALSKPMMALFVWPLWVFFARTVDRIGKGVRTGARDAMLSVEASAVTKARVFGFHRSMDTIGAVIGPALALVYLYYRPADYRTLFLLAFVPGILAILATLMLRETTQAEAASGPGPSFLSSLNYWSEGPAIYRKVVGGMLVFTLVNSSDVFLLMRARESGLSDTAVIGAYIFYNLIYALAAFPAGVLGDRVGVRPVLVSGLAVFAAVYVGMALTRDSTFVYLLFLLYGIYGAATEGLSKAWISHITPRNDAATALGTFSGLQSICTMLASTLTGAVWMYAGAKTTFLITAAVALGVAAYFLISIPDPGQD